ncbi:MAG: dNTP triphosphohydrolase [Lachnospiraceae bacterium]|nr:dNTP triphosphohydrolase [Ruminococcus sp.]MCM1273811.1 dNTP triphosphohydrolase [Lachnospiraceae bacterium]
MFTWDRLLCAKREREHTTQNPLEVRTEFRRDYHRIIGSASFRRLQDKAQVYPLKRGDFVRTRLTHSLEVSSFAESLGDLIFRRLKKAGAEGISNGVREDCCDILRCAGLIHDIGNPPFGHFGEFAIRQWFKENLGGLKFRGKRVGELLDDRMKGDFFSFEGNAQALRIVSKLHCLTDMSTGMNLTYALLNTIIKYPVCSTEIDTESGDVRTKKMGYFCAERELFGSVTEATGTGNFRHPLTFILEAADDIAYLTADIEDAVVKGYLDFNTLERELRSHRRDYIDDKELYDVVCSAHSALSENAYTEFKCKPNAVQRWIIRVQNMLIYAAADSFCANYGAIMNGEFKTALLADSPLQVLAKLLGDIAYRYAFRSADIVRSELSEDSMMSLLLDKIVSAALRFDTEEKRIFDRDLTEVLSENYLEICRRACEGKSDAEQCYRRLLFATDCVCGMTDSYAEEFFRMLSGNGV